jgi:hypothetical protein
MRKGISILIVFCVLAAVPVYEVSGASIAISKLSKKTAGPFDVIKIYGAGFTAASDMRVIFANGAYVVTVPAIYGSQTTLEVGVPFFFDTKTRTIKSGVVKIAVKSKSLGIKSNTLTGFTITDLPRTTQAPGTVTQAFLGDLKTLAACTQGQLQFLQMASKGKVNTTKARSSVSKIATSLGSLQTALAGIQKGKAATLGSSITISKASLAISDRLILGFLAQLDAVVKSPSDASRPALQHDWVPPDGLTIPSLTEIFIRLASYAEEKGYDQKVLFEYLKRSGAWVGTTAGAVALLAGEGSAVAAAAGAVGLAYGIGVTGFVLTEYGCYYLGLASGVNEAEGFWGLLKDVLKTSLAACSYPLASTCTLKALAAVFLQSLDDFDLAEQLMEPVKKSAPAIYQEFHFLNVVGSWAGKFGNTELGYGPITASFTESGLAFSGTLSDGYDSYPVSGARLGYSVSFDLELSIDVDGEIITGVYEFVGTLSQDRRSMSGDWEWTAYGAGQTESETGTWSLTHQ